MIDSVFDGLPTKQREALKYLHTHSGMAWGMFLNSLVVEGNNILIQNIDKIVYVFPNGNIEER